MRCPTCRAETSEPPACRRCKADLTLLFDLEEQRQDVLNDAARCLARGQVRQAQALAEGANALRAGDDVRKLLALACLLRRDFAGAWRHYQARVHVQ